MSESEYSVPVKRVEGDTLEERMNENGYHNLLPSRYQLRDEDGEIIEEQEEVFERVAKNIAVAEAVHEDFDGITEENAHEFSYDDVDRVRSVQEWADRFQDAMENLKFMPNTPTIINAGDDMQQLSACISGDTPIYTEDGLKLMRDVSEGDSVLTHTGEFKRVKSHWSNGYKGTLDVKRGISRGDNYSVAATPDHEFLTQDDDWKELVDIETAVQPTASPEMDVPESFDLTQYTSLMGKDKPVVNNNGFLRVKNSDDPRTGRFDKQYSEVVASVENSETLAFLAGVYLAEGDVDGTDLRFTINSEAEELQEKIVESLQELFDVHVAVMESNHGNWKTITASSPFISDFFVTQFGAGTTEKRIPKWVFSSSKDYQRSLLQGVLVDGHDNGSSWKLTLANPTLAYESSLVARNVGYESSFTLRAENELSKNDTSRVIISKEPGETRLDNIVKRVGEQSEVFDMEVEDDHSFVAGDFIVHNCFVDSPEDDMEDIGRTETEASLIFQSGGGVGYDFSDLRPYGDSVGSTGGIASGPITFMQRYDQNCETVAQGGVRRGAQMATMDIHHPDVIQFIHAKNKDVSLAHTLRLNDPDDPTYTDFGSAIEEAQELLDAHDGVPKHLRNAVEGHLSNFNISVKVTDEFMQALQNGKDYTLYNPRTGEPHVVTEETAEMYGWFDIDLEVGEELTLPAEKIWERVVEGAYENGEPGVIFIDRINEDHTFNTSVHPEYEIKSTNPCVTGDTLISTEDGLIEAGELYERQEEIDVVVDGRMSEDALKPSSGVFKTGEKDVYKLVTEEGFELRLTSDHEVMTSSGWTSTEDLSGGEEIHVSNRKGGFGEGGSEDEGRVLGWLVGDGHLKHTEERAVLNFYDEDSEISENFAEYVNEVIREPHINREYNVGVSTVSRPDDYRGTDTIEQRIRSTRLYELATEHGLVDNKLKVPDGVYSGSEGMARGFLQALFTADGGVQGTDEKGYSIRLGTKSLDLSKGVQSLLLNFGIYSKVYQDRNSGDVSILPDGNGGYKEYDTEQRHEVTITSKNLVRFQEEIGFLRSDKSDKLQSVIDSYSRGPYDKPFIATVESVEYDGHEGVYDLTEPDTSSFIANGLVVHNCSEQPLMEYEACNLGHINLSTIVSDDRQLWDEWLEEQYGEHVDEIPDEELRIAVNDYLTDVLDMGELDERIEVGTRFLDNVVTMSDFPIPEIEETVSKNRKIGLGIMGLAQLFIQLGVEYGSDEANMMAEDLMKYINHTSKMVSHDLGVTRGSFSNWEDSKYSAPGAYPEWFRKHVGREADAWKGGMTMRNHNTTTIAPTGSTSILGDTSGGCEPIYNVAYYKNVTDDIQGDEMLVEFDSLFLETLKHNDIDVEKAKNQAENLMEHNEFEGPESIPVVPDEIAQLFVTTSDLDSKEHASVLCALQEGVDSSISKTLNAPYEATLRDAKDTFEYVYENGGKSVTFYRDGTRTKQVNTIRQDNEKSEEGGSPDETPTLEVRERPKTVHGETHKIQTGYGNLYVTINEDEHGPVEAFATVGKSGANTESFTEAVARLVSLNLRAGVPVPEVIDQLRGIRSPQYGFDNGEKIKSVPDGVAVALERYYDGEDETEDGGMEMNHTTTVPENFQTGGATCPDCGKEMVMREGCEKCPDDSCGYSKC